MATLRVYVDGGYYIHRGYPIRRGRREDEMFHTTIQVLPRAERFFDAAGYKDGQTIKREVYYALLLDGDLSSPSIDRKRPTINDIPSQTIYIAEGLADSNEGINFLRQPNVIKCRYLFDYYQAVKQPMLESPDGSLAAYLSLARYLRQAAYDREHR